jgi:hypothetical protein
VQPRNLGACVAAIPALGVAFISFFCNFTIVLFLEGDNNLCNAKVVYNIVEERKK